MSIGGIKHGYNIIIINTAGIVFDERMKTIIYHVTRFSTKLPDTKTTIISDDKKIK